MSQAHITGGVEDAPVEAKGKMTAQGALTVATIATQIEEIEVALHTRPQTEQVGEQPTLSQPQTQHLIQDLRCNGQEAFLLI